ncbi:IS3 family transposase [Thermosipho melanesiensis]|nr:IS3 family transposase [Thermosipho melanesiensis]
MYGYSRITMVLNRKGRKINHKKVYRDGAVCKNKKKESHTQINKHNI